MSKRLTAEQKTKLNQFVVRMQQVYAALRKADSLSLNEKELDRTIRESYLLVWDFVGDFFVSSIHDGVPEDIRKLFRKFERLQKKVYWANAR